MSDERQRAQLLVNLAERTYTQIRAAWFATPMIDGDRYARLGRIRSRAWGRVVRRRETLRRLLYAECPL